ncbi:AAA family ATPase [Streptomyces sp. NPDC020096]
MAAMFVDRVAYIGALDGFLRAVARGEGGVFLVEGEQGIGKSALLQEAVRRAQAAQDAPACRFVQVRCLDQIGVDNAYGPLTDVLTALQPPPRRSFLRRLRRSTVQAAPDLAALVPTVGPLLKTAVQIAQSAVESSSVPPDSVLSIRQSVTRTVANALSEAAALGDPTIIVLDDVQWLDPSSLLVLEYLVESLQNDAPALGLVLGYRSDPGANAADSTAVAEALASWELRGWLSRHRLTGLPEDAVAALVREYLAGQSAESLPARLSELTKGHPAFVMQFLRLVGDDGKLPETLPDSVGSLIGRRLARLDADTMELLVTGATQGETFDSAVVARVTGRPPHEVARRLHQASRRYAVIHPVPPAEWAQDVSADHYRFDNALLRMTVLEEQSAGEARERHGRIATALVKEGTAHDALPLPERLEIARHFRLAQRWDDAAREQFAIARGLLVNGLSFSEAEALCLQAVESIRRMPSTAADRDTRLAHAIELLLSITEARWQGRAESKDGQDLDAWACEAQEAARRSGDPRLMARTTLMRGRILLHSQGLWPALDTLEEAVELARQCADPAVLFVALAEYGSQLTKQDLQAGLRLQLEAQELYGREPALHDGNDPVLRRICTFADLHLGVNLFDAGRFDQARERLTRSIDRLRGEPLHVELPVALNYLAQLWLAMGAWADAGDALREATRFEEEHGDGRPSAWHAYNTALLALLPSERARCRALVEAAWHETEQTWLLDLVPIVRNVYAEVVLTLAGDDRTDLELAGRLADETIRETRQTGMLRSEVAALSLRSRTHLRLGETAEAARLTRQALAHLERVGDLPALRTEEVLYHAACVLRAAGDREEAEILAGRARAEVVRKAELIESAADRERFIREAPLNRAILEPGAAAEG